MSHMLNEPPPFGAVMFIQFVPFSASDVGLRFFP